MPLRRRTAIPSDLMPPDELQTLRDSWGADRIAALRERLRLKQPEFGLLIGYSHGARVSELERSDRDAETPTQVAIILEYIDRYGPLPTQD